MSFIASLCYKCQKKKVKTTENYALVLFSLYRPYLTRTLRLIYDVIVNYGIELK